MSNTITLYSISDLLEMNFFVPSYQRGYRWTEQQVEELLSDLYAFQQKKDKKEKEFYCLQPVVVKSMKWKRQIKAGFFQTMEGWELIDGQQRLTTLRILLAYLTKEHLDGVSFKEKYHKDFFSLEYETRTDTEVFLNSIEEDNEENIDFYHIAQAYQCIRRWFERIKEPHKAREAIINILITDRDHKRAEGMVQVIWFEVQDSVSSIDTFIRINLGKIPLTNSELIKALFLQEGNFGDHKEIARLRQLEIAAEWDRMEYALHDEDFWWFINKGENKMPSRIEFLFDLICTLAQKENPGLIASLGRDRFVTFRYYYQLFDQGRDYKLLQKEWARLTELFQTLQEWYEDAAWYHYAGFLIYSGEAVADLYHSATGGVQSREEVTQRMKSRIQKHFARITWALDEDKQPYLNLYYKKPNATIRELLLFFNLQCIIRQCEAKNLIFKFPFKRFKEERWDIEHIDSYTENPIEDRKTQEEWLKTARVDLRKELAANPDLAARIEAFIRDEKRKDFAELHDEIIRLAGEEANDEVLKNNIGNLTLLDAETNRSYGNALFRTKRRIIIEKDRDGVFIPLGTKNVFLKYFDLEGGTRTQWSEADVRSYRKVIEDTLEEFLPVKPKTGTVHE